MIEAVPLTSKEKVRPISENEWILENQDRYTGFYFRKRGIKDPKLEVYVCVFFKPEIRTDIEPKNRDYEIQHRSVFCGSDEHLREVVLELYEEWSHSTDEQFLEIRYLIN